MEARANMNDCITDVKFCPSLPSDRVLRSGAVIFPGVYDQVGSALVFFPVEVQLELLCVTKEEIAAFVYYCLRLHRGCVNRSVAVVADLRTASVAVTRRVAEILLLLKRTVHTFYIVQPKKRDVQKLLQKLLCVSKRSAPVKCVFVGEVFELSKFVDRSQLTADLGGYLTYSHESWSSFIKEMDGFVQECVCVVRRLPVFLGALHDFSKLFVPTDLQSLTVFCSTNQTRLERLRSDLGLDTLLRRCKESLEKFRYPETDPCYRDMMGTVLYTHTALEMLQNYERIQAAVEKVELLWRRIFSSIHLRLHVLHLQRDSQQVVCEMECVLQQMQSYTPETLRDSKTAEALQLEFNTSVHTHAAELVRRAERVLNSLSECVPLTRSGEGREWANHVARRLKELRALMELQKKNLNIICTFHHCYHKMERWYHAAVCQKFLQDLLWRTCLNQYNKEECFVPHKQFEVFSTIQMFFRSHPPPEVDELEWLAHLADVVPDAHLESAGKQLASRCLSLRRLLISPGSATFRELQSALQWQYEYLKGRASDSSSDLPPLGIVWDQDLLRDSDLLIRLQPGTKPSSLSSVDSGFEGAGSNHLEPGGGRTCHHEASRPKSPFLPVNEENVTSVYENQEKFLQAPSIHVIPNASGDSVNVEITVKRSAKLPTNPWLSLPVDDLESCYTVIISPSRVGEMWSCDQLTQTADTSVCDQEQTTEWSSIANVLSSTITDSPPGADLSETTPTLLWDSYDLHVSDGTSPCEQVHQWELKEQQELRAVEDILNRTAEILQEEENVLVHEGILDVLLEADSPYRMWPSWSKACDFTLSSTDFAEADVIGLEDDFSSYGSGESPSVPQSGSHAPSEAGNVDPDRTELLKEMEHLKFLKEQMVEENFKLEELCCCDSNEGLSSLSLGEDRRRFLKKMEQEKKEVEELQRNLSREMMKSKIEGQRPKIVRCSVLGKSSVLRDDEALLMNCRSSAKRTPGLTRGPPFLVESTNQKPSDMVAEDHVHHQSSGPDKSGHPECSTDSSSSNFMNINCALSVADTGSSAITPSGQGPATEEPQHLVDPHDMIRVLHLNPSETLDTPGACNEDPSMDVLPSGEVSSPAFDPGGTPCLPSWRRSPVELLNRNSNNNNVHTLEIGDGMENGSEHLDGPEDEKPEVACKSRTSSLLLEAVVEELVEEEEQEMVEAEAALTRRSCSSSVLQQLHICTREMSDFLTPVVLDTGSSLVKAGFADQDLPTTIFPTAVGLPKYTEVMSGSMERGVYVGHDAQHMRGVLTLHYPVRNSVVSDWEQMEMIWTHAFEQLCVCSEDHPVLLTEGAASPREHRQRSIQIMFESFNVPLAYTALQPVLTLYTTGRTTGVVFDSGGGVSHSVPVVDGYCLPHAVQRFNLAGNDVTLHLQQLLMEQGVCMRTSAEIEMVREMKESCCCVALNYEAELRGGGVAGEKVHYTLPDGQVIFLTTERFRAPEILFRPELIGQDYYGMHESIFRCVLRSDVDLRRELVGNIVLSGGNTLLSGLPARVRRELGAVVPAGLCASVKVTCPDDGVLSVWRGGAVLASMQNISSAWVSRQEYEEFGPHIVYRKCF